MVPKIVALISTYKEEEIISSCIKSAFHCDSVIVFDGSTESNKVTDHKNRFIVGGEFEDAFREAAGVPQDEFYSVPGSDFAYVSGSWNSDAHKRTEMLNFAKRELSWGSNAWALWLDGDEILLWGEYLHDHCQRADHETATGGTTLRIQEYDGSVAECFGKLIKLHAVEEYVMSSYEIKLSNGMTVALPNVPLCTQGGIPIGEIKTADDPLLARNRPPLQGEPHLLHRFGLRNPERQVARMHDAESDSFAQMVKNAGLDGVERIKNG